MATYEPDLPEWERLARACGYRQRAMAKRWGRSPRHLRRRFKQHFGRSLREWLTELRLKDAERLLRSPDPELKVAALTCSFKHYSNFSRWFKAHEGIPPSGFGPPPTALPPPAGGNTP
jgi:transcriptional regulator GlxA family with amidase domain